MTVLNTTKQHQNLFDLKSLQQAIDYHQEHNDNFQRGYGNQVPEIRQAPRRWIFGPRQPDEGKLLENKMGAALF